MDNIYGITTRKVSSDDSIKNEERILLSEHHLELYVNGLKFESLICTRTDLKALITGRLLTEGLTGSGDRPEICISEDFKRADVSLIICDRRSPEPVKPVQVDHAAVRRLASDFMKEQPLHEATGATHTCILMHKGEIIGSFEDIGRHNAMDKAIGTIIINDLDPASCILYSSGRIPTDIVMKAAAAGIPIIASKAMPTKEAVDLAFKFGITLCCRAWKDGFDLYEPDLTEEIE